CYGVLLKHKWFSVGHWNLAQISFLWRGTRPASVNAAKDALQKMGLCCRGGRPNLIEALLLLVYRRFVCLVAFSVSSRRGESSGFAISRNNHVTCGGHLTSLFAHKLVGKVVDPLICPRVFNRNALHWIVFAIEFSAKFRMCRLTLSIDTIS